ncbi:MAG: porin [Alcaligenaceae bacterium]|nr:porin [Alcaligenaceae bacterium]
MNKTLLAAALIVGFAGAAQAETSVTLYGILDTGYGYQNYKYDGNLATGDITRNSSGVRDGVINGNRFGLRGSEDLGDGLRAIFRLEQGFNIGDGTGSSDRQFHRQAWVGLSSDNWGSLTVGRQYNMGNTFTNEANATVVMGDIDKAFGGVGSSNRMDNSFKYVTPSFSGFQAGIAYGNPDTEIYRDGSGTQPDESDRSNWLSTGIGYSNGPLTVGLNYDRQSGGGGNDVTSWAIGGAYDFEVVKLHLAYGQDRDGKMGWGDLGEDFRSDLSLSAPGEDFKSDNYYVALSAPVGGGTLVGAWTRTSSNLDDRTDAWADAAGSQNVYYMQYKYPLSKRTSLYGYASYGTNLSYIQDLDGTEAGIGINHKF